MSDQYETFEADVREMLEEEIKASDEVGTELWSALANVTWYRPEGGLEVGYSFRSAGGLIAEIAGRGNYMTWYCSGPYAEVSDRVAHALRKKGWIFDAIGEICDEPGCISEAGCGTPTPDGYRWTCSLHMPDHST